MSKPPLLIHITKTAGTAISQSGLAVPVRYQYMKKENQQLEEMIGMDFQEMNPVSYKHIPYSYLDREAISRFDRKFAVVRNPWSRMVSLYNYADKVRELLPKNHAKNISKVSFNEFLDFRLKWTMFPSFYRELPYNQWALQMDWVIEKKNFKVDILRYENINEDLSKYLNRNVELPIINKGSYKDDYKSYYNDETAQIVHDWFRLDIERWGFTFDSGATRNYWGS